MQMVVIPWTDLTDVLPFSNWSAILAAVSMLTFSSVYSLIQVRFSFRATDEVVLR